MADQIFKGEVKNFTHTDVEKGPINHFITIIKLCSSSAHEGCTQETMYSKIENLLAQNQQPAASTHTGQVTEKGLKWGKDPMLRSLPN